MESMITFEGGGQWKSSGQHINTLFHGSIIISELSTLKPHQHYVQEFSRDKHKKLFAWSPTTLCFSLDFFGLGFGWIYP